eukprot:scaffold94572_cov14-Tisochrysis_lutea.AAC.1
MGREGFRVLSWQSWHSKGLAVALLPQTMSYLEDNAREDSISPTRYIYKMHRIACLPSIDR